MKLTGINEIKQYLDVTESTVMDMILIQGLPAKKDKNSVWVSDTDKIAAWQGADKKVKGKRLKAEGKDKAKAEADAKAKAEADAKAKAEAE